jgi:hypothetical protein
MLILKLFCSLQVIFKMSIVNITEKLKLFPLTQKTLYKKVLNYNKLDILTILFESF